MSLDNIIHIIVILFGAGGVFSYYASVRRIKAQNVLDLSTAWEKFATPLMKRVGELETKVTALENENSDLRDWAERLVRQVIRLGGEPESFTKYKS